MAMNGGIFPTDTSSPFAVPPTAPVTTAISAASATAAVSEPGNAFIPMIDRAPERASSEPTERSIPAPAITKVIPSAIMPLYDTCRVILIRF